jgi:RHS repeat-associated protein
LAKAFSYSPIGNLLSKSDVGTYSYPLSGSPRPHAVTSVSGGVISTTFGYDPNGNQTAGLGRSIVYSSYNKPASITQGTRTISFLDDTEHQRFKQVTPEGSTLYISAFGVLAELANPGASGERWTEYLSVGNAKVGMRSLQTASETLTTRYFHTDHLGSIAVITNENGVVVERLSYDAWGKRRNPDGTDDTTGSITSQSTRGFTGEEQLSVAGLVHLNGRVYDPLLARMTSADPTVTDPMNPQGWNRYSYVGNDPLAFTDPNGFSWLSSFFHDVTNFFRSNPIARAILQIAATLILAAVLAPLVVAGTIVAGAAAAAAAAGGSAIATGLSGGNFGQILRASAIAGATAFAFFEVGGLTNAIAGVDPSVAHIQPAFGTSAYAFNVAGHALVGCGASVASGGSCQSGALSAGVSAGAGPFINGPNQVASLVKNAGGGKFANGAVTGAFGYMFNAAAGRLFGGYVGAAVAGTLGIESGPGAIVAGLAGRMIGGELGSRIEDWLWGNPDTLAKHFDDHGADFGAASEQDYVRQASQFLQRSQAEGLPTKIDSNGTIRIYDPASNTFGSYNADGTTKTYYKPNPEIHGYPSNIDYWNSQRGQ